MMSPSMQAKHQADYFINTLSEDVHLDDKLREKYTQLLVISILRVLVDVKAEEYKRN